MKILSDDHLLDAYQSAVRLRLDQDFIKLLLIELKERNIQSDSYRYTA